MFEGGRVAGIIGGRKETMLMKTARGTVCCVPNWAFRIRPLTVSLMVKQLGFPGLRALHPDCPPPPPNCPLMGLPNYPPWASPTLDATNAEAMALHRRLHNGLPPPAHEYSEESSPMPAFSWSPVVKQLQADASYEESRIKLNFFGRYPAFHPDRLVQSSRFIDDTRFLHGQLACCQAIFFRRCVVEEAVTSAIDAQAGAIVAARNEAEIQAVQSLLTDEYLSTWLSESILSISDWGTADDSRNPPPPPPPVVSSTTWGNAGGVGGTGGWGMGGGWGAGGGWNNVGNGWGNLGGGWDDGEWTPRRRWFPSHRGIRRMGAVFRTEKAASNRDTSVYTMNFREHRVVCCDNVTLGDTCLFRPNHPEVASTIIPSTAALAFSDHPELQYVPRYSSNMTFPRPGSQTQPDFLCGLQKAPSRHRIDHWLHWVVYASSLQAKQSELKSAFIFNGTSAASPASTHLQGSNFDLG
ncbi:hypothetical protein B0H13DRAFT_1926880 [Mycena leptocephala]|nr:hypothetical protein B0H13DRAFT_1926880 [Mycena leptocephala]